MYDISYIFGINNQSTVDLDKYLHSIFSLPHSSSVWVGIIERYYNAIEFMDRHTYSISDKLREDIELAGKYLTNYGYLLFNYLPLEEHIGKDIKRSIWLLVLFDYVWMTLKSYEKKQRFLRMVEHWFVVLKGQSMPYDLAISFCSHPIFYERYFSKRQIPGSQIENKTILGKLINPLLSNVEYVYDSKIFQDAQTKCCGFFNELFMREPTVVLDFFGEILLENQSKVQVGDQTYINDNTNSYDFICNLMVYLNYILTTNSDYETVRLPISNLATRQIEMGQSDEIQLDGKLKIYNKMYWMIYDFYRISFYSLILQNLNSQNLILLGNQLLTATYNQHIEANNKYLENPVYNEVLYGYFIDFMSLEIIEKAQEDIIYDMIFYMNYVIEYRTIKITTVFQNELTRFLVQCLELPQINNPFIKIKIIKMVYLLKRFYMVDIPKILYDGSYGQFQKRLVQFLNYIDKMSGLDKFREAYQYKTNILTMLIGNSDYILEDKGLLLVLMNDVDSVIQYKIGYISSIFLSSQSISIDILKEFEKIVSMFLNGVKMRIDYLNEQFNKSPLLINLDLDIKYHLIKYIYGIVKNCYDQGSVVIKTKLPNSITGANENKIWDIFVDNILKPLTAGLEPILRKPGVVEMINRFYPDLVDFIKKMDTELGTDLAETYHLLFLDVKEITYPDDMPEEFLDPLLFSPIRDPIILPDSHVIVDRAVIQAHLAEGEYDPFNRQPLTMEQLIEYNQKEEQHKKLMDFIEKRNSWLNHYHSHNGLE